MSLKQPYHHLPILLIEIKENDLSLPHLIAHSIFE